MNRMKFFSAFFGSLFLAKKVSAQITATPVGVMVRMSDGSEKPFSLGTYLGFLSPSTLQVTYLVQYVNQNCVQQADGSWKIPQPGKNLQVWRNGLLQIPSVDYVYNQARMLITPIRYDGQTTINGRWNVDDKVISAYLY